jgi:hypothetical protein
MIYDTILWLKSQTTGKRFPVVVFSADRDKVTEGCVALTSVGGSEIVVTQLTADEYQSTECEPSGYLQVETHVTDVRGRSDLKGFWLVRVKETAPVEGVFPFKNSAGCTNRRGYSFETSSIRIFPRKKCPVFLAQSLRTRVESLSFCRDGLSRRSSRRRRYHPAAAEQTGRA